MAGLTEGVGIRPWTPDVCRDVSLQALGTPSRKGAAIAPGVGFEPTHPFG